MAEARWDVKLLGHWASVYVIRARIALNLKGIDYEFLEEGMGSDGFQAKSELLLSSNPVYKKIPVLLHGGKPICESLIILQYIDEAWPANAPAILPSDPHERAVARFWSAYVDEWIFKLFKILMAKSEEAKAEAMEQVTEGLSILEGAFAERGGGGRFFGGGTVGYVDIALGCSLGWLEALEELCGVRILDKERTPELVGWAGRFRSDGAVKGVLAEKSKFVEFAKMAIARRNPPPTT